MKSFNAVMWNKEIDTILTEGLNIKFTRNEDLCDFLKATGDNVLSEVNPMDKTFGVGLSLFIKDI